MTAALELVRNRRPVHPFPARMAPEIVRDVLTDLEPGSTVVDPMCGSGVVLREAVLQGHEAFGFDVDPLAVLMSKVWTRPLDTTTLLERSETVIRKAERIKQWEISLPWIDEDEETVKYIEYWFERRQREELRKLAFLISGKRRPVYSALQLGISRVIVTKKVGASLAWDVSHSRPHRMKTSNDYSVLSGFEAAVSSIAESLKIAPSKNAVVKIGDARRLSWVADGQADVVITSPPYFNAIDYIRGHRLALVWLGYQVSRLRKIRSLNVGRQRGLRERRFNSVGLGGLTLPEGLDDLTLSHLRRYVYDMSKVMREICRIVKPTGRVVLVIGSSNIRGQTIDSPGLMKWIGQSVGLRQINSVEREIPNNRRYLPPPTLTVHEALRRRMRSETVLTFEK